MNRRNAFQLAKKLYPDKTPHVACGFCSSGKGKDGIVVIPLHETDKMLVLYSKADLSAASSVVEIENGARYSKQRTKKK